jgi:ribosomal protein S18 acetylase RimI-like enzyme
MNLDGKREIIHADTPECVQRIRVLFREYAETLGFSLCFQGFDDELSELPGMYSRPSGCLLLAGVGGKDAGCIAVHPLSPSICEMKRLYVRPAFRRTGVGRALAEAAIREARVVGYEAMRLDTIEPLMPAAVKMYRALGFRDIEPYRANPINGALYLELRLTRTTAEED